jgi:two-component system chemotaxis sensor kinase CheA
MMKGLSITSVAAKMAGATIALIVMVTAGIYWQLSRYQRESLLHAKEVNASAVMRLFADSCAAAVVFEDPVDLRDTLATLGRNEEIEYATVWAVNDAGHATRQLAELRRGRPEAVTSVPATIQLRRDSDRVVPVAPVRNIKGKIVGVLVAAFSLAPENAAISRLERTALLISTGVAVGLTLLLMAMARLLVVGPLAKLVGAAKRVEEGRGVEIDVHTNDEVGQLAHAFRSMASAIQVREGRINARNRDMRLVLDNVGQGFITLNQAGAMSEERSRIVDEWFGPVERTMMFWDYLQRIDPTQAAYFEVGWSAVMDRFLPLDLCLDQLPKVVHKDGRTYELTYRPILDGETLDKTIIVITDVTVRLERERSEQRQRETMAIHRRLIIDRPAFDEFFAEASALVVAITETPHVELATLKRQVHTLKGNCGLFGIESVAGLCHAIEDRIDDAAMLGDDDRARLRTAWTATQQTRAALVDAGAESRVAVDREDYDKLLIDLRRHVDHEQLAAEVETWEFEPAGKRLALIREQIELLARRLGKAPVDVSWPETSLRLPPRKWGRFWSAFAHVVRNTVDHGVETQERRATAGKTERAAIRLGITRVRDQVLVSIQDDGPGVDWAAIAERARERGLPCGTRQEIEAVLFADGISSRTSASGTSGRGVGLAAIRDTVRDLGGRLELTSHAGPGTLLRCWLPESMLVADQAPVSEPPVPLSGDETTTRRMFGDGV